MDDEMMVSAEVEDDGMFRLKMEISELGLLRIPDNLLDKAGEMFAYSMKRKRNELLCDRDGHIPEGPGVPPGSDGLTNGIVCGRCHDVLDEKKYEWLKAGAFGEPPDDN